MYFFQKVLGADFSILSEGFQLLLRFANSTAEELEKVSDNDVGNANIAANAIVHMLKIQDPDALPAKAVSMGYENTGKSLLLNFLLKCFVFNSKPVRETAQIYQFDVVKEPSIVPGQYRAVMKPTIDKLYSEEVMGASREAEPWSDRAGFQAKVAANNKLIQETAPLGMSGDVMYGRLESRDVEISMTAVDTVGYLSVASLATMAQAEKLKEENGIKLILAATLKQVQENPSNFGVVLSTWQPNVGVGDFYHEMIAPELLKPGATMSSEQFLRVYTNFGSEFCTTIFPGNATQHPTMEFTSVSNSEHLAGRLRKLFQADLTGASAPYLLELSPIWRINAWYEKHHIRWTNAELWDCITNELVRGTMQRIQCLRDDPFCGSLMTPEIEKVRFCLTLCE